MEREPEAETEKIESALQKALSSILLYRALFSSEPARKCAGGGMRFLTYEEKPGEVSGKYGKSTYKSPGLLAPHPLLLLLLLNHRVLK